MKRHKGVFIDFTGLSLKKRLSICWSFILACVLQRKTFTKYKVISISYEMPKKKKLFTIVSPSGKYWEGIDDMNSGEDWATAYTFWTDKKMAIKCLKYHRESYPDKYGIGGDENYDNWKVIGLKC